VTAGELGRKLHELDVRLRAGTVSRADYRKIRRKAIRDLEDPQATITAARADASDETVENQIPTRPLPPDPPTLPNAPTVARNGSRGSSSTNNRRVMWIFAGIGALVALAVAAWLMTREDDAVPASAPLAGVTDGGAPAAGPAAPAGPDLPQTVADTLVKSEWADADIAAFLAKWNGISPEARRAARDDQVLWLLRGETDRRLHEAVDAAALDPTPQAQSRIDRLSALQAALRPE
jgi:hypothetical protein